MDKQSLINQLKADNKVLLNKNISYQEMVLELQEKLLKLHGLDAGPPLIVSYRKEDNL